MRLIDKTSPVSTTPRSGFTLIELLTSIAIIGVLIALILPAVQAVREAARKTQCKNNLKQMGVAIHNYHDTLGMIPPSRPRDEYLTWYVLIMPFAEQQNIYDQFDVELKYADQDPEALRLYAPYMYCASRRPYGISVSEPNNSPVGAVGDYAGNAGWNAYWAADYGDANGVFNTGLLSEHPLEGSRLKSIKGRYTFGDIKDGLSNTIFIGEKAMNRSHELEHGGWGDSSVYNGEEPGPFMRIGGPGLGIAQVEPPAPGPGTIPVFGSDHATVVNFLMGDGSVQTVWEGISEEILGNLCDRKDSQVIDLNELN